MPKKLKKLFRLSVLKINRVFAKMRLRLAHQVRSSFNLALLMLLALTPGNALRAQTSPQTSVMSANLLSANINAHKVVYWSELASLSTFYTDDAGFIQENSVVANNAKTNTLKSVVTPTVSRESITATQTSFATSAPQHTPTPVMQMPATDLEPLFNQYGQKYGVSPEVLRSIAFCESSFNSQVTSPNGLYGGLYQYLDSTWRATRSQMQLDDHPDLRYNAKEAIKTTAFKIAQGGIGAWPQCGRRALQQVETIALN